MDLDHIDSPHNATTTGLGEAVYKKVESLWPGGYYVVGWVFAAAGIAQVAVAAGVGLVRLIRRRRAASASGRYYSPLPTIPEVCSDHRAGCDETSVATAA